MIESDLRRNHPLKGNMTWIKLDSKPWKPLTKSDIDKVNQYSAELEAMKDTWYREMSIWMWGTKEQKKELMDEKLGIIPKEPQWRPADPVDWPRQVMGRWVPFEPKVNETNTLDNPHFEDGNWPGYLGHADDFRP